MMSAMNLPDDFTRQMYALLGENEYKAFMEALDENAPVSVRLNKWKAGTCSGSGRVAWCDHAYYLGERPSFTFDPLFHAGCYYVQEASSMFVGYVIRQLVSRPSLVLDLCAAPGGKTTDVLDALPEGSFLVSNEVIKSRARVLSENVTKWGAANVAVTNSSPEDFGGSGIMFDVVIVDAPCSGEGMFRKDAASVAEWSPASADYCSGRQKKIIADVWDCLKPGGLLIYSTCTYNIKENEDVADWMAEEFGAEPVEISVGPDWNIGGNLKPGSAANVYRFMPHRTKGEGFTLSAVRKTGEPVSGGSVRVPGKGRKRDSGSRAVPGMARDWCVAPERLDFFVSGHSVYAIGREHAPLAAALREKFNVLQQGICVGEQKGCDLIPAQSLALSRLIDRNAFACAELDYDDAVRYLRKEGLVLDDGVPGGFVLVTFEGKPLGFVKHLGTRANNLYPAEWKIKSGFVPSEYVRVCR